MRPPKTELLIVLGALTAFAPLSIDMYLPAFPQMEIALAASTDAIRHTLAAFFLGFALGQASYGPVTDRFGRKPPLYFGLGLYILASIGCALAPSAEVLTVLRFVQAVGACSGMVIARAMVRDLFEPKDAARAYSSLMLVTGLAPILAPIIGGIVLLWAGWTAIFWLLACYAVLALAAVHFRFPETHPADPSRPLAFGRAAADYGRIIVDRRYLGYAAGGGLGMAGMFAYIAGSPFVFIDLYGVPAQDYGWLFGLNALGFVVAAQVNGRLLPAGSHEKAMRGDAGAVRGRHRPARGRADRLRRPGRPVRADLLLCRCPRLHHAQCGGTGDGALRPQRRRRLGPARHLAVLARRRRLVAGGRPA